MNDNRRISNVDFGLMVGLAVICDLLGPFGAVGGPVVFFLWFRIKKVPIIGPKQLAKQLANLGLNALGEIVTAGIWAGVTVGVIITIVLSRIEDKFGVSLDAKSLANPTKLAGQIKDKVGGGSEREQQGGGEGAANDNASSARPKQMNDMKSPAGERSNVIGGADRFKTTASLPAIPKSKAS